MSLGTPGCGLGYHCPRHLVGPGEAPKGTKMDERPGSTEPEEFRGVVMPLTHIPSLLDPPMADASLHSQWLPGSGDA